MTDNEAYIHGGADFLTMNQVRGNAVQEWRWEGFLHWKCPLMKIYVGGRAQQAYGEAPYKRRMRIWSAAYPGLNQSNWRAQRRQRLREDLRDLKANFVIGYLADGSSAEIVGTLLSPDSSWTMVYYDRENVILGDSDDPQVQALVDQIVSGQAKYPDYIPGLAAATRAMCMANLPRRYSAQDRLQAVEQANREMPSIEFLKVLIQMQEAGDISMDDLVRYFTSFYRELEKFHENPYEDLKVLFVRQQLAWIMSSLANKFPQTVPDGAAWQRDAAALSEQCRDKVLRWR
jgi:hypothetical protein